MNAVTRLLALALAALAALASAPARADDAPSTQRLQVADAYVELHTGPGRGYPVFFVAERSAWIVVDQRRTDWYRVQAQGASGQTVTGWVNRAQLERTLTEAGVQRTFRDMAVDDYLQRRLEMGASWGRFESDPMLKLWGAWRLSETLAIEGTIGQVQGLYSGTDLWHLNLSTEPWSDQRWSPAFTVGVGRFANLPNDSLVDAVPTDANLANASLGLRVYFSRRFVARVDYTLYTAFLSDQRNGEYRALTAGLSFFF
ncbi:MAG: hypothetical protein OEU93_06350 [Rubrivivax sp.]|nr:hypothetical protein [Rubrivivax sp.]MDH5341012.1 hypothetical protein [Rubrivivax sp.]